MSSRAPPRSRPRVLTAFVTGAGAVAALDPWNAWPAFFVHRVASLTPGSGPTTIAAHERVPAFSPAICYEIIFPGAVTSRTGARPAWLVNVTNDAWFGESPGPHQHFAQARFRAVEEGLPVVRVANSGVSGVVDPLGRVVTRSELFTATVLDARLPRALPPTPYAELGDGPVLALLVLTSVAAALLRRRERSRA